MRERDAQREAKERGERVSHALSGAPPGAPPEALDRAAVADWIDALLARAVALRVTDVHLDLADDPVVVRCRIDGVLHPARRVSRAAIELALDAAGARTVLCGSNALSLERFAELGIDPGRARERVGAVVHQRLVRVLCAACKAAQQPDVHERPTARVTQYRAVGCAACAFTGFRGRTGVFAVEQPADADGSARAIAARLREDGTRHVLAGLTTRDEVVAVIPA